MKTPQRILSGLSLFLLVMLLFLLIFQERLSIPPVLQSAGRTHPLLLHLPIGMIILAFIFWITRKSLEAGSFQKMFLWLLHIASFVAALTALMGFFLSLEGGYEDDILSKHKFSGTATAIFAYVLRLLYQRYPERKKLFSLSIVICTGTMIVGSHFGAVLTHGEDYVWEPLRNNTDEELITDSSTLFAAAVRPVLKAKCFSCHNEKKTKGDLVMTTEEKILKGGKNGAIWVPGDAANSRIIQYIHRDPEDKKHMPPKGKPQLSDDEKELLFAWIQNGADITRRLKDYNEDDPLMALAASFIGKTGEEALEKTYSFSRTSSSLLRQLNNPFCAVLPLSQNSPALQADFFIREKFEKKALEDLLKVKEQLVSLDLGNMPVGDEDMKTVSRFTNLEKLNLNNTGVTTRGINEITSLKKLVSLSLAGTAVDKQMSSVLSKLDSLKEVYTWNSGITADDAKILQKEYSHISFNTGYMPDENEILPLTVPMVKNEEFILSGDEKIELKHPVPGVIIRFTTDGSIPDSVSAAVYSSPLEANAFVKVKARAVKPGWYSSPVAVFSFYRKGIVPDDGMLINQPDERYRAEGIKTLTDGKMGAADNFRDGFWLGYREKPFDVLFHFSQTQEISSITLNCHINVQSYIMPPAAVEIWGGNEKEKLTLLKRVIPGQLTKENLNTVMTEGIGIGFEASSFRYFRVVARNITRLPSWHPGKGDPGWFFIDEIFFN